ncbi:hypothetical protein DM02DRAFT_35790 [Periconia macrospinosa]|uniref:Uncharacterized protein n=1 Tax=Periconia macrospinosa TaxID=97972 RepID=A0A2V1E6G0_9PLEO|nr:hypothetical protein DM02DRAFT_35790 [Periconia macrospinosa]
MISHPHQTIHVIVFFFSHSPSPAPSARPFFRFFRPTHHRLRINKPSYLCIPSTYAHVCVCVCVWGAKKKRIVPPYHKYPDDDTVELKLEPYFEGWVLYARTHIHID